MGTERPKTYFPGKRGIKKNAKCKMQIATSNFYVYEFLPDLRCLSQGKRWHIRKWFNCFLFLSLFNSSPVYADEPPDSDNTDAPIIGRKEPFWGAVGQGKFQVTVQAVPTELQVGDPILLTIRITSEGPWLHAPGRPDLIHHRSYPEFVRNFQIENEGERFDKVHGMWEFDYRLRPRPQPVSVNRIPPLGFFYFRPGFVPLSRGYMFTEAKAISLTVHPRAEIRPADVTGPPSLPLFPEQFYQLREGNSVIKKDAPIAFPGPGVLAIYLFLPPLLCFCWFRAWVRFYPDAVRQRYCRQSQAGRQALKKVRAAIRIHGGLNGGNAALLIATYLRERFELLIADPTPSEVVQFIAKVGCPLELGQKVELFFRACDSSRFAPGEKGQANLAKDAFTLIQALEAAPCGSRPS